MNQRFASFKQVPLVPYRIFEKLVENQSDDAESLFKLLKHATTDALSQPNLTYEEKMALLWSPDAENSTQENLFTIFLKPLIPSALGTAESQIQLRIYKVDMSARSQYESVIPYRFDIITNEVTCMVRYEGALVERTDLIEALILELLNGSNVGIGIDLRFDRLAGAGCNSPLNINNSKSLFGRSLTMALRYIDSSLGGGCSD